MFILLEIDGIWWNEIQDSLLPHFVCIMHDLKIGIDQ